MEKKMSRVSSEHLEILRLPELRVFCEKLGVPKSGNKGELISRLVTARISYDMLLMDDLKDILYDMESCERQQVRAHRAHHWARFLFGSRR